MSMPIGTDDVAYEGTSGSFWEVSQYKRTVNRIDNGVKLCDDLLSFIKERAIIEENYNKHLKQWSAKFGKVIEKNSSYNTLESTWINMLSEADKVAALHLKIKDQLLNDPYEKIKQYKKDNYQSLTLGGFKQTKSCNDEFQRAQKQWAKYLKKVNDAKKVYFNVCKEEKTAQIQESNATGDSTVSADRLKKLHENVEKKQAERTKQKDKYEKAIQLLTDDTPRYMEDMEKAFQKCQDFEEKRLNFFKDIFFLLQNHLDLANDVEFSAVYADMKSTISQASAQEDLQWWRSNHGPDMPMNWPQFEEYDAEKIHMQRTVSRSQGSKISKHVAGVGGIAGKQYSTISEETRPPSTANSGEPRPDSWSDDDQNPFHDSSSEGNAMGSDTSGGVLVRAIYNYDGQEDDELSFSAGDTLYKLEDEDEQGWCKGRLDSGKVGLYPANYVEVV